MSVARGAKALEEFTIATVEVQRARAEQRTATTRATDLCELAALVEQEVGTEAVELVELLVAKRLKGDGYANIPAERRSALDIEVGKATAALGGPLSDSIRHMVAAAVEVSVDRQTRGTRAAGYTEDRPPPSRYRGVWQSGKSYEWGDEVTHSGGRWWAKWATDRKPGDGQDNGWQLTHKTIERERVRR